MARNYYRAFISLSQASSEYAKQGRFTTGRCVLEAKGREGCATCYIQDLRAETQYKLYLISSKNGACAEKTLFIDAKGKCGTKFQFDADNFFGTGETIEDINVVAVVTVPQLYCHNYCIVYFTNVKIVMFCYTICINKEKTYD